MNETVVRKRALSAKIISISRCLCQDADARLAGRHLVRGIP